jgi:glycosyltransferase involved in cell wall biosynthesis
LPAHALIACYTGKMTEAHNEFLLQTAAQLAGRVAGPCLMLVGGNPEILDWTRRRIDELGLSNAVLLTGFVAPSKVGLYQSAADVLVYYMPESIEIFDYCTPAKGFEYQAARRPIVATDIPLFEEVFGKDDERAIRVRDRTPKALADGIIRALDPAEGGEAMSERAAAWVSERTWARRTAAIVEALGL